MKLYATFALFLLLAAAPMWALESDDPLLDAKIAVAELSSVYGEKHPKLIEARARVDLLSRTLPANATAIYAAHVQDRLRGAQQQDDELSLKYGGKHPQRVLVAEKMNFLRAELQRTER